MGPFFFHWYGFAMYLISILDFDGGVVDWIFLAVWFCLTVGEQILQIVLLPKVFDWAYTAPTIDNGKSEEEAAVEEEVEEYEENFEEEIIEEVDEDED